MIIDGQDPSAISWVKSSMGKMLLNARWCRISSINIFSCHNSLITTCFGIGEIDWTCEINQLACGPPCTFSCKHVSIDSYWFAVYESSVSLLYIYIYIDPWMAQWPCPNLSFSVDPLMLRRVKELSRSTGP